MEGVVDSVMRDLLCSIGGIDVCVTEFIRINDHLLPDKVFYKRCPELHNNSLTKSSNTPVRVQLLGGKPQAIAENAASVANLGASAIDLNFGCPAKTVNNSDGGACLLKEPKRVYSIIAATRAAVPKHIPVTAKIRLGFDDRSLYLDNALAAYEAGANELTVHARSKADGYKPPAYWDYIADITQAIPITVNANGDIWSLEDLKRCREVTGCTDFMLGRGLLSCPDLALQIKAWHQGEKSQHNLLKPSALELDQTLPDQTFSEQSFSDHTQSDNRVLSEKLSCEKMTHNMAEYQVMTWAELCPLLLKFFNISVTAYPSKHMGNRLKQWLFYLSRQYPEAVTLFEGVKRLKDQQAITQALLASMHRSQTVSDGNGILSLA
jgi:tRNA-dihydrouridine synthase C